MGIYWKIKPCHFAGVIGLIIIVGGLIVLYPPPIVVSLAKSVLRSFNILRAGGEDHYIERQMLKQLPKDSKEAPPTKLIETSKLPIQVRYFTLPKDFPEGAGAITAVNDKLIIMSRTGGFYRYHAGNFVKLDWSKLPNEIEKYIVSSNGPLNSDTFRASYLAYDEMSRSIFVGYTKYVNTKFNRLVFSSLKVDPLTLKQIGDWKTVFEGDLVGSEYGSQAGGGRVLVDNGYLYFSLGYSESLTMIRGRKVPASQNISSTLGKIYRLNIETNHAELISMGHRNVQGLTFTRSRDLLSTEHGPQGGDEINIVRKGANFGWPYRTYGTDYGSYNYVSPWEEPRDARFDEPMYAFVPSIGLSPIHLIEGFHPAWDGDILVGSLKAQSLFRLVIRSQRVVLSEPIWIGHRIRDIALIPRLGIMLLTDDSLLAVLTVDEAILQTNKKNVGYNFEPKLQRCLVCHHFEQSTPVSIAPSLANIVGRRIGGDTFEKYSDSMKKASGKWDKETLRTFLINPQSAIPGTSMPNLGLSVNEVDDIVKILSK